MRRPPLVALLSMYGFCSTFSVGAFPALLPEVGAAAGLADWQIGLVAGLLGFARMAADVPVGLVITHHLRRTLTAAPFLLAIGALCLAGGGSFALLALGRGLMGVGHARTVVSGLTALLRFAPAGAMGSALTAFEMSAMLGVLGGTVFLRLLPSRLPWNAALLIGCSPQLLTFAVLPRLLTAIPRDPETAARPIFAEKKVVTPTRTHDRRRISDQTGRKTFRAAQCRSGCRSNDRVGDDGHAPRGLAAGSVEAAGLMTGVAHGRWTHGALPPPPTPIAVVPLGSRPRRMNADLSVRDSSSFACRVSPIVCPSLFTIRCGEHSTETREFRVRL